MTASLFDDTGANFSACRTYRYKLWRRWNTAKPHLACICLNPSTADEVDNDPTVKRLIRRAMAYGAGGLVLANLYAYRSTDPDVLPTVDDPVGPENDTAILDACRDAMFVLCGWGKNGTLLNRAAQVLSLLRQNGITPMCLATNTDGSPTHPLYLSYELKPLPLPM